MLKSQSELGRSLQLELYATRTKNFVGCSDIELHIGDVEFLFVIMLHTRYFLLPILLHCLLLGILVVFFGSHEIGGSDIHIADFGVDNVIACSGLIFHLSLYVIGILQIERRNG